ncbi:MAG: glycosyltransferase family 9 protein [Verrucomicrobiota bacterium JB023]|nr:glycosyltransferase family 9 protein [Verrucomicrobiota bacterium JB023]
MSPSFSISGSHAALVTPLELTEACLATPAFRAIHHHQAPRQTTIVCPESQTPLWQIHFSSILSYPDKASTKELANLFRSHSFTSALLLDPSPAAKAMAKLPVAQRLGPASEELKKLLTESIPPQEVTGPPQHRVTKFLDLAERLNCDPHSKMFFLAPSLPPRPLTPLALLAPGSDFGPAARWPIDRFVALARMLKENDFEIALSALPGHREAAEELASQLKIEKIDFFHHVGLTLAELLAILPTATCLIASHSSLSHLAAHTGLPVVNLMGPHAPGTERPLGRIHASLTTHAECSPCRLRECPLDHRCLEEITAEMAMSAVKSVTKN